MLFFRFSLFFGLFWDVSFGPPRFRHFYNQNWPGWLNKNIEREHHYSFFMHM